MNFKDATSELFCWMTGLRFFKQLFSRLQARVVFITLVVVLVGAGCASIETGDRTPTSFDMSNVEDVAKVSFAKAEGYFKERKFKPAEEIFNQIKHKHPKSHAAALASYRLGMIYYYLGQYARSSKEFESHLTELPDSGVKMDGVYNWAAAEFQQGNFESTIKILSQITKTQLNSVPLEKKEAIYGLLEKAARNTGNTRLVLKSLEYQLGLGVSELAQIEITHRMNEEVAKISEIDSLSEYYEMAVSRELKTMLAARLGSVKQPHSFAFLKTGLPEKKLKPEAMASSAEEPVANDVSRIPAQSTRSIGILLPLSGKSASLGQRALEGVLAASEWLKQEGLDFVFYIRDTGSSPYKAEIEATDLIQNKGVMALVGPLHYRESKGVADLASYYQVPNITLTSKEGITEGASTVFQNAVTPRVQIDSLVRYCIEKKELKRFGTLFPNDNFGREVSQIFWDLVEKYGGRVSAFQSYSVAPLKYDDSIQELAGLLNVGRLRPVETDRFNQFLQSEKEKTKKVSKAKLRGIPDFDALFIPEGTKNMAQIAPALAFYDLSEVLTLGILDWNSDTFLQRSAKYLERILIPAGLTASRKNPLSKQFLDSFQKLLEVKPDLVGTQSFEALLILTKTMGRYDIRDKRDLLRALVQLKDFSSPLGSLEFDERRIARRNLTLLHFEKGVAERVEMN